MKIYNNYNPVRYVKSLYNANKKSTHYIEYPKRITPRKSVFSYIKNFFKNICSK